ncbi:MAG: hypothetical protein QM831_45120 [Kofleriaceae bacterium]
MKHFAAVLLFVTACHETPEPLPPLRPAEDAPALDALRAASFDQAVQLSTAQLAVAPKDAEAAAIHGLASWINAANQAYVDFEVRKSWFLIDGFLDPKHASAIGALDAKLEAVDHDMAVVAADPRFAMELCLACWQFDWNHDGTINERDLQLLTIDQDDHGKPLPEGDPRRKPTFRFDVGDALWVRAMISFQRAGLQLVMAYNWADAETGHDGGATIIHLKDPARVAKAKELVLAGLDFSDASRKAYLDETDDDREWVPSPKQKSHPIPLDVDDGLYKTWSDVVTDVRDLMAGKTGIPLKEIAGSLDAKMYRMTPDIYIDVAAMFDHPQDILIRKERGDGESEVKQFDDLLHGILGKGYAEHKTPSPLVKRLLGYAQEMERGGDSIEHKLRYLMWIN